MIPGNLYGRLAFDRDMNEFLGRKNILCTTFIVRTDSTILSDIRSSSTISQRNHQQHFEKASLSDYWCQVLKERKIQQGAGKTAICWSYYAAQVGMRVTYISSFCFIRCVYSIQAVDMCMYTGTCSFCISILANACPMSFHNICQSKFWTIECKEYTCTLNTNWVAFNLFPLPQLAFFDKFHWL